MLNTKKERFHEVMERLELTDYRVYTDVPEITKNMMVKLRNGETQDLSSRILEPFCRYYSQVNPSYILTGEGDMLKEEPHVSEVTEVKSLSNLKSKEVKIDEQMVNLYDFEASAGLRSLLDNNHANIIGPIHIPNLPKCDGAIHIVGDSMYPMLKSGDIVLYKEMPVDMQHLFYGEMYLLSYIIEGDAYVVVKYINKSPQGEPYVTLVSQNPHHADVDIDFRTVNALALVKATIRINCMM
ncbi:S24 family peptidase [Hoylesella buccalis]|uniref:Transcriptional regulator n=1 Tax=Hoylesella buccalis DNF00853 TaxID=1401074 RepID=A0A095ZE35_9BACT|nr:S24 family peptidase [Hoylesella buccalis]KGF32908.1 transcriptional regulator [Hoylesella buccalis DNF00853]